jgi:integrase
MFSYRFVLESIAVLAELSKKRDRDRLKIQRDPHFMKLAPGAYLGYRRGPNTWHARFRDKEHIQHYKALEGIGSEDYDGAMKAAEAWFEQMGAAAVRSVRRDTVRAGLEAYLTDLRRQGRAATATEVEGRFKLTVYKDAIANLPLESATRDDFEEWRDRLREGRANRSVNRQVRAVKAALEQAVELGHIANPAAWRLKPLSDSVDDDGETAVFLDPSQRAALIAAADPNTAAFLRGLELTGARPKELAGVTARDFDGKTLEFSHRKGGLAKLRVRYTVLGKEGVEFFAERAKDKLPSSPLFTEDGEQTWRRHIWARQFRAAIEKVNEKARGAARIPLGAGVYSFRHARISELLQVYGVDPLTVGHQTGTSLPMIEKAYTRFIPQALQEKLANLKAQA